MKIVSWNIERGYHPDAICRLLAGLEADVYLLTEVDRGNRRTRNIDMFGLLQERLGLPGRFAVEFDEKESLWRSIVPIGGPGGGVHGNAVLTKLPIENYEEVRLPFEAPLIWDGGTVIPELFEPRRGSRVAQVFDLRVAGTAVSVVNTHLENWRCGWSLRRKQLEAALAAARSSERILAGDLNCLEGIVGTFAGLTTVNREVPRLRSFLGEQGLVDPWQDRDYTCFNYKTRAKLDWLCVTPGLTVLDKENIRTQVSDHNCLTVSIEPTWSK